jgi:hypothetical protein
MLFLPEKIVPSGEKFSFLKRGVSNNYSDTHFACQLIISWYKLRKEENLSLLTDQEGKEEKKKLGMANIKEKRRNNAWTLSMKRC